MPGEKTFPINDDEHDDDGAPVSDVDGPFEEGRRRRVAEQRAKHSEELVIADTTAGWHVPHRVVEPWSLCDFIPGAEQATRLQLVERMRKQPRREGNKHGAGHVKEGLQVEPDEALEQGEGEKHANDDGQHAWDRNGCPAAIRVAACGAKDENKRLHALTEYLDENHDEYGCLLAKIGVFLFDENGLELAFEAILRLMAGDEDPDDHPGEEGRCDQEDDAFEQMLRASWQQLSTNTRMNYFEGYAKAQWYNDGGDTCDP